MGSIVPNGEQFLISSKKWHLNQDNILVSPDSIRVEENARTLLFEYSAITVGPIALGLYGAQYIESTVVSDDQVFQVNGCEADKCWFLNEQVHAAAFYAYFKGAKSLDAEDGKELKLSILAGENLLLTLVPDLAKVNQVWGADDFLFEPKGRLQSILPATVVAKWVTTGSPPPYQFRVNHPKYTEEQTEPKKIDTGKDNRARYYIAIKVGGLGTFTGITAAIDKHERPYARLCQYGGKECDGGEGYEDFFKATYVTFLKSPDRLGPTPDDCRKAMGRIPAKHQDAADYVCKHWPPENEFASLGKYKTLWEENKATGCAQISNFTQLATQGKYTEVSPKSFADYHIDALRIGYMYKDTVSFGWTGGENKVVFCMCPDGSCGSGDKSNNACASSNQGKVESETPGEYTSSSFDHLRQRYKRFMLHAGSGNVVKSSTHFMAFHKDGNEFILYDHEINEKRRGVKLNMSAIQKLWELHQTGEDDRGKPIKYPNAYMKVIGIQ